jgi:hypothetical protein
MLPVVYEKYNYLLSMNINAEIYKFSFTEKNFSKCAHLPRNCVATVITICTTI